MADYTRTEQTVTRVRYVLSTPSNGAELSKALMAAARQRADQLSRDGSGPCQPGDLADDALRVDAEDDRIVIWWEIES